MLDSKLDTTHTKLLHMLELIKHLVGIKFIIGESVSKFKLELSLRLIIGKECFGILIYSAIGNIFFCKTASQFYRANFCFEFSIPNKFCFSAHCRTLTVCEQLA